MLYAPLDTPPAREQVIDENDYSYYQHYVDQASTDMEAEAKKPEDDKNNEDGPKHDAFSLRKHGVSFGPRKLRAKSGANHKVPGKITRLSLNMAKAKDKQQK